MARARRIETRITDAKALELRRRGLSYAQVAEQMGWKSQAASYYAVQRGLADTAKEASEEVRAIELARLDELTRVGYRVMFSTHYVTTQSGRLAAHPVTGELLVDDGPVLAAMNSLIRVAERRAKLLGLDRPIKHEVRTIDAIDARLEELARQVEDMEPATAPETA